MATDSNEPKTLPDARAVREMLDQVAKVLEARPKEELIAELRAALVERADALEERLRPFRTPVTEETLGRRVG